VLRAGPEPYVWATPGRIAASFITDSPTTLTVVASARVPGDGVENGAVVWEVQPPAGFSLPDDADLKGPQLRMQLQRPEGNSTGGGEPLSLKVTARLNSGGKTSSVSGVLTQDLRDRLRQEYVDLERASVPGRDELLDERQFARRYRKRYPDVSFAELNWSKVPGSEARYPAILAAERLVRTLHEARRLYSRPVTVSSGFRNPVRQQEVHGSVGESHHQYGRALDLYVAPDSAPPQTGRKTASEMDWLRLASASLRAGGVWIEPMLDCHVNTDGCHVHVDVRESGAASQVVRVTGRVTDAWGNPVPGATVRLAGMPAFTNARGEYTLKHVVTPRDYELEIEAPGRGATTQPITIRGAETVLAVRLPVDPQPTLTARAADSSRDAQGNLTARVALRNIGGTAARGVHLSTHGPGRPATVKQVLPADVATLAPGEETMVHVQLALGPTASRGGGPLEVPLQLSATFRTPEGTPRTQTLPLKVTAGAEPSPRREQVGAGASAGAQREPPMPPPRKEPEIGPAVGGLAAGGAAAALGALTKRRGRPSPVKPAPAEPSVDPGKMPESPAPEGEP
jgi:hypothetical protein